MKLTHYSTIMVNSLSLSSMITRETEPTLAYKSVELSESENISRVSITSSSMIAIEAESEVLPGWNINVIGVTSKSLEANEMKRER